ncbi:MAG: HAD family hydrolase [Bacteroidetes bacterium]|jgi:HAD superfamily hydrolase (TIGR01549 family)|nr:HAD family hydrolase [Bacteroidota bacterium]
MRLSPQYVYFDLDDTLLDHKHAERSALSDLVVAYPEWFNHADPGVVASTYKEINRGLWIAYGAGEIDRPTLSRQRFQQTVRAVGGAVSVSPEEMSKVYMEFYADHWTWLEGAENAFERIAGRYAVGVVTNGFAEIQRAKLDRFPAITRVSTANVISEEVGYLKPDRRLFEHAAEQAGKDPRTILYVGDSLVSDVEGGIDAGWQVAWYNPAQTKTTRPEAFSFADWDDLCDALAV